jgi:hypothetical protein
MLCQYLRRFVEALLEAGRPATALAVQRARCAGGGASSSSSSSLNEAEVLLRVQLGGGLLAEAFCDLRRHCNQVGVDTGVQRKCGGSGTCYVCKATRCCTLRQVCMQVMVTSSLMLPALT